GYKAAAESQRSLWILGLRAYPGSPGCFVPATASRLQPSPKFARSGKRQVDSPAYSALMKITLLVLGVSDLSRSVAFYRDKAGFDPQSQSESLAFFAAGPIMLMLNAGLRRPEGQLAGAAEIVV